MVTKAVGNLDEALARALVDGAFLSRDQVHSLMRTGAAGESLRRTILEKGILPPEVVASVLAFLLDLPVVDVRQCMVQPAALELLPDGLCRSLGVIPISVEGDVLRLVTEEPLDERALGVVESLAHLRVKPILALNGGVQEAIDRHYRPDPAGQMERVVEAWEVSACSQTLEGPMPSACGPVGAEPSEQTSGDPRSRRLGWRLASPFTYVTNAVKRGPSGPPPNLQLLLWLGAIMFFGFGDTLTSLMVFGSSGREANVLLAGLLRIVGPTVAGFVAVKMAATLAVVVASRLWPRLELFASLSMLTAGMFLVAQNSTILLLSRV